MQKKNLAFLFIYSTKPTATYFEGEKVYSK